MITIRRLIVTAAVLAAATACSATPSVTSAPALPAVVAPAPRTAEQIVTDLAAKVGTAKPAVVFTAETDPNKLLGRPNGYISKASFTDGRIKISEVKDDRTGSVDQGGSVEVYADEAGAAARKKFIDDRMKATPILGTEYSYVDGPVLLRVSRARTPGQAAEYEAALTAS